MRSQRIFFLKITPYDNDLFVVFGFFTVLEKLVSGDSLIKRKTATAVKNAGILRIQKDHLHTPKKTEIKGEKIRPINAPTREPVVYKLIPIPLFLGLNHRNTKAEAGAKIHPEAKPQRTR